MLDNHNINKNAVIYSVLPLSDKELAVLHQVAANHKLTIPCVIIEQSSEYHRSSPQPRYRELLDLLSTSEINDIKHVITLTLNHLFLRDAIAVMNDLRLFAQWGVLIHTPKLDNISINTSAVNILQHYCNHRGSFIRKLAANAKQSGGGKLGRPKLPIDAEQVHDAVVQYGSITKAAKIFGCSITTLTNRLVEGGFDVEEVKALLERKRKG